MVTGRTWLAAFVVGALLFTTAAGQDTGPGQGGKLGGSVTLSVSMSGYTQAESYNPQKYQFSLSNSGKVNGGDLAAAAGGELSGDAFAKAFKEVFNKAPESGASTPTVSGSLKGEKKGDKVELSGNITVKWSVQGGKGQKQVSADLKGSMGVGGGNLSSLSLTTENIKVGGSWNWGGGGMALKGEATFTFSSK